jgi:acetyl-CoA carboxylase carboxyltransferase component
MKDVIKTIGDNGEFYEVFPLWAMSILTGFTRLDGMSVGVIANQPKVLAGTLDFESSEKAARFVRFCDAFNIPIVVFEDVPGFLPGTAQECGASSAAARSFVRVQRGDRPEDHRHHAEGVRRRVRS